MIFLIKGFKERVWNGILSLKNQEKLYISKLYSSNKILKNTDLWDSLD